MAYFEVQGCQIHYLDQGTGETVVFAHGTPTNSGEYRDVIAHLSSKYRCIAIDHLGFGHSEKPEEADYSIPAHRKRLAALLIHLDVRTFHLVVHDFGGVIALPLQKEEAFRVISVTILNSWLWPLIETEPQMRKQKWLVSSGVLPFLYRNFNFSPRILIKMGWGSRKPLSQERHRAYVEEFPKKESRSGTVSFLMALFDFDNPCWQQTDVLAGMTKISVQIIWGLSDQLVSPRNLERWQQLLPNARIHKLERVGHFVAEEAPDEVASFIDQMLSDEKLKGRL